MSKILCTLAWYHDGGTLKPQLVFSSNPVTNLVMKGTDWKGARISNTNAGAGARNRFEYSFTGGKSVTRCSLVMNTSAILPPMIWLSKHPCGPPTKTGPRGKEAEQARRKLEWEKQQKLEDGDKGFSSSSSKKSSDKRRSPSSRASSPRSSPREQCRRQEMLDDRPYDSKSESRSRSRQNDQLIEDRAPDRARYDEIPDRETRRLERRRRLENASVSDSPREQYVSAHRRDARSASPREQYIEAPPAYSYRDDRGYGQSLDHEARRRERRRRLEMAERPSAEGGKYRRSHRRKRDRTGEEGADGYAPDDHDQENGDGGGDGGGGGE